VPPLITATRNYRRSEQRHLGRRKVDPPGCGYSGFIEKTSEDHRAPRSEIISIVVE
jgi:hypothetical protein